MCSEYYLEESDKNNPATLISYNRFIALDGKLARIYK